mmetsp:Transcript_41463/g.130610  ORF Transcript_41463/g.130610 Transcript_41463/m.130610 type:complete len:226 (+) Transcript_41463:284-961(+)
MNQLVSSIRSRGFAVIPISHEVQTVLKTGLTTWSLEKKFRYPPVVEHPPGLNEWRKEYRDCYDSLLGIAAPCFHRLCTDLMHASDDKNPVDLGKLRRHFDLESSTLLTSPQSVFTTSFMNLFNYRWGFLGPHRDRCLVTVIFTMTEERCSKRLWARRVSDGMQGEWFDVDKHTDSSRVIVFAGEEMNKLTDGFIPAIEHSVGEEAGNNVNTLSIEGEDMVLLVIR